MISNEQPIVITGASTGIGKATALHLDKLGFRVFAGMRKEADGQALKKEASEKLTPTLLDVADGDSIATAVERITEETSEKRKAHYQIGPGAKKMKNLARLPVGLRDWLLYKAIYSRRRS